MTRALQAGFGLVNAGLGWLLTEKISVHSESGNKIGNRAVAEPKSAADEMVQSIMKGYGWKAVFVDMSHANDSGLTRGGAGGNVHWSAYLRHAQPAE